MNLSLFIKSGKINTSSTPSKFKVLNESEKQVFNKVTQLRSILSKITIDGKQICAWVTNPSTFYKEAYLSEEE